ncbi:hypothetical protein HDU78_000788 [Chytriomyces hyalinus]|nr:hypothetical protein HDU78_000788 [Chytriomyces hyalinus]
MLFVPQFAHAIANGALEWSLDQFYESHLMYPHLCEYLAVPDRAATKVKAYFDFDLKFDSEALAPSEDQECRILRVLVRSVASAFVPVLDDSRIAVASRHRAWTPERKFKFSYRLYVLGAWTTMDELCSVVKHIQVHPDCSPDIKPHLPNPLFDTSVYSKGRKMNCLGKSKSAADDRLLLPWTDDLEQEDFLIQHVPDTWPQLSWSESLLSALSSAPSSLSAPSTSLLITDPLQVDIIKAGFQQVLSLRPQEIQSLRQYAKTIVAEVDSTYCHGVKRKHSSNRTYLVVTTSAVTQKCHDPDCKDNAASVVRTQIEKFPAEFRTVVHSILEPPVTAITLKPEDPMYRKLSTEIKRGFVALTRFKNPIVNAIESIDGDLFVSIQPGKLSPNAIFMDSQSAHYRYLHHVKTCGEASELCLHSQKGNLISIDCSSTMCPLRVPEHPNSFIQHAQPVTQQYLAQLTQFNFQGNTVINVNAPGNDSDKRLDLPVDANHIFPDNPALGTLLLNALHRGTAAHVGKFAYEMGKGLFGVNSAQKSCDEWWAFMGRSGRWVQRKQNVQAFFQDDVPRKIADGHIAVSRHIADSNLIKRLTQRVDSIIKSLEDVHHLNIMAEAAVQFKIQDPDFVSRFNQKQHLISFKNGVFDLRTGSFRDGEPTDMLTVGLNYDYPSAVDPEIRAEILRFFEEIQPDPAQRKYLLCFLGSMLMGGGGKQHFHIFTGQGRNGKSVLSEILKVTLELDFFKSPPATFLMNERPSSDRPCADLISMRYARVVIVSEPGESRIKSGFMKALTGQDSMEVRNLHESTMVSIRPAFTLVMLCNVKPTFDVTDPAVWDRSRILDFPTKFVELPSQPHERKMDDTLPTRIKDWGPQMMLLMIEWYNMFKSEGLTPTAKILAEVQSYQEANSIVRQWYNEHVVDCTQLLKGGKPVQPGLPFGVMLLSFNEWWKVNIRRGNEVEPYSTRSFAAELRKFISKEKCGVTGVYWLSDGNLEYMNNSCVLNVAFRAFRQ